MNDHYRVKFPYRGETRYGIVDAYSPDAKEAATRGELIIEDAVFPVAYCIPEVDVTDIPLNGKSYGTYNPATGRWEGGDEFEQHVHAEYDKAEKIAAQADGVVPGAMFAVGVADGSATYVITKVNKKTCRVEWRGFHPDRYTDHHFGYGGTFPIADIARYVGRSQGLRKLFREG